MNVAIDKCQQLTGKDLPSNLKITSISSRLTNLQHLGEHLFLSLANKPTTTKAQRRSKVLTRSESTSASEVSIREQLAALQTQFSEYKQVFEERLLTQQASRGSSQSRISPVSPILMETRAGLKSAVQENGHTPEKQRRGEYAKSYHLSVDVEGASVASKTASLGRRTTIGLWWEGKTKEPAAGNAVKERIAMLNEKSKEDDVPIQELGADYGQQRLRARSAGSAAMRQVLHSGGSVLGEAGREEERRTKVETGRGEGRGTTRAGDGRGEGRGIMVEAGRGEGRGTKETGQGEEKGVKTETGRRGKGVEAERGEGKVRRVATKSESAVEVDDESAVVPLHRREVATKSESAVADDESALVPRRRGKGLSKAERSRRIEDIKKLFETEEIAGHLGGTGSAESAPAWSPREYDIKAPSSAEVDKRTAEPTQTMSSPQVAPLVRAVTVPPPPVAVTMPPATHPPEAAVPRERLNTAPTIIRTIIKDHTPPNKKQVITISMDSGPGDQSAASASKPPTPPLEEDLSLGSKLIPPIKRASRSASPTNRHRVNSVPTFAPTSPASPISSFFRKGNGRGLVKGKVSSLRSMFDSNSKANPADPNLVPTPLKSSTNAPLPATTSVATNQQVAMETSTSSHETTPITITNQKLAVETTAHETTPTNDKASPPDSMPTSNSEATPSNEEATPSAEEPPLGKVISVTVKVDEVSTSIGKSSAPQEGEPPSSLESGQEGARQQSSLADGITPANTEDSNPPRPRLPSPSILSPHYTPPPRPPPPLGYYDHPMSNTPNLSEDWDSDSCSTASESGSSLLDEADMEWIEDELVEWDEDEVDIADSAAMDQPDSPHLRVPRPLKSMRKVLSDFLTSEQEYLRSLEVLTKVYLRHTQTATHLPSFLHGAETKIFAHLTDLYTFQR